MKKNQKNSSYIYKNNFLIEKYYDGEDESLNWSCFVKMLLEKKYISLFLNCVVDKSLICTVIAFFFHHKIL